MNLGFRNPGSARGERRIAARPGPLTHPRDVNFHMAVGGGVAQRREWLRQALTNVPVPLRAQQHIGRGEAALRVEQLEEIHLVVHDADDPGLAGKLGGCLGHIVRPVEPGGVI